MPESFKADVQYNDFKGTIAIDGHEGDFLNELAAQANIPEGYYPVGFQMWNAIPNDDDSIPVTIIAARCEQVGHSIDDMINYNQNHGELPVHRFDSRIAFDDLRSLMKRLDIKVLIQSLENVNVAVYGFGES
jgi:hypothetical protein